MIRKNKSFGEATGIKIFGKNEIWIKIGNNLIRLNEKGEEIILFKTSAEPGGRFGKLSQQRIWVQQSIQSIHHSHLEVYDSLGNKSLLKNNFELKDPPKWISTTQTIDKNNDLRIWHFGVGTLISTDENGEQILDFSSRICSRFPKLYISNMASDQFNNTWLATSRGLILISPKTNFFQTFLTVKNPLLGSYSMRGMQEIDDHKILASTYQGFFLINKLTGDTSILPTVSSVKKDQSFGLKMTTIGDSIFCGKHGVNFWIINKNSLKFHFKNFKNLDAGEIHSFYQDKQKQIWICSAEGLFWLDLSNEKALRPPRADLENDIYQKRVNHFFENGNEIFISTEAGLFTIDHQGALLEDFEELSNFQINCIHPETTNNYWLATKGSGLILWNRVTHSIQQFSKEQGLSDDFIYTILEDEFGFFWLPSNNGLMRFNPKDFSVNIFNEGSGIADREFNLHSHLQGKDGQIYLGGTNGITTFHPRDFQFLEKNNIPLLVTAYKKLGVGEVNFKTVKAFKKTEKEIVFQATDKAVALEFCLLDYSNSFQSKYAYKIKGYDDTWNYMKSNRLIINRLPYGNYTLQVKAQGSYGTWSEQVLTFPLYVVKPFYLTWTFLGLVTLSLVGLIYGVFRWRIIQLKKQNVALESIVEERTKELADLNKTKDQFFAIIAHDMRGLVLSFKNISQKVGFLQRKGRDQEVKIFLESVDKSAESLSNLLDNLLNWALVEKGVFPHHPELFNLERIVIENIKLFTQMSRIKEIELSYDVPETLNLFADKNAISTIIRNLINNAIKFSTAGDKVIIEAFKNASQIQIQIKDTGIGIAEGKLKDIFELDSKKTHRGTVGEKGTGLGLMLCKELVALNQGEIRIESGEGKGTKVYLEFPLVA